jgi:Tfp pilus assembly protein PilO
MENKSMTKWIVALCLTAVLAVIGWTVTVTLAQRMKIWEEEKQTQTEIKASVIANTIRLSVLENKYDMIATQLAEIKALIQKHMDK